MKKSRRVLVLGHQGMVGSAICRNAPSDTEIMTVDRSTLSITDRSALKNFLTGKQIDGVILCAAKVGGIAANQRFQKEFLVENLDIQNSVLMASADAHIPNFIFLGSSCIYPKNIKGPISESQLMTGPLEQTNEGYALAKIAGIRLAKAIYDQDGLNFMSVMPSNIYGSKDNYHPEFSHVPAALIRRFHEAMVDGSASVQVWGSGKPRREFLHVDDLASACWFLMSKKLGGQIINVGTGEDISIKEFALLVARVIGYENEIVFDHSKPDGTMRKLLDVSKIHTLGWRHRLGLSEGLNLTYAAFLKDLQSGALRG